MEDEDGRLFSSIVSSFLFFVFFSSILLQLHFLSQFFLPSQSTCSALFFSLHSYVFFSCSHLPSFSSLIHSSSSFFASFMFLMFFIFPSHHLSFISFLSVCHLSVSFSVLIGFIFINKSFNQLYLKTEIKGRKMNTK